jgi:hypothetical protein
LFLHSVCGCLDCIAFSVPLHLLCLVHHLFSNKMFN